MHGLKSSILAIFQKLADWLDWTCPVSAALQNSSKVFFFHFYILILIYFFEYETIVRSRAWSFGHSDPDPSSVKGYLNAVSIYNSHGWLMLPLHIKKMYAI